MAAERPDLAAILAPILERVDVAQRPLLIALAERMAAVRYRGWASQVTDAAERAGLRAGADREEGAARRGGEPASLRGAGRAPRGRAGGAGAPRLSRRPSPPATCGAPGPPGVPLSRPGPSRAVSRVGLLEGAARVRSSSIVLGLIAFAA